MAHRIEFLVAYVGSAASVAFLAACMTSARIESFECQPNELAGTHRCELATTLLATATEPAAATAASEDSMDSVDRALALLLAD